MAEPAEASPGSDRGFWDQLAEPPQQGSRPLTQCAGTCHRSLLTALAAGSWVGECCRPFPLPGPRLPRLGPEPLPAWQTRGYWPSRTFLNLLFIASLLPVLRVELHIWLDFHIRKIGHMLIKDHFLQIEKKNHSPFSARTGTELPAKKRIHYSFLFVCFV